MDLGGLPDVVDPMTARAFAEFVRQGDTVHDAYYGEETRRFELRPDDVLVAPPDLVVSTAPCGVALKSARANVALDVCHVTPAEAGQALVALGRGLPAREAEAASGLRRDVWNTLVQGAFGKVVFAPLAVAGLERRVSSVEIVRFPGSPYEIVRSYWENLADVAERITAELDAALSSTARFVPFLRSLHATALVGASGTSFYRPASPIARKRGGVPGELLVAGTVVEGSGPVQRIASGPRVGAGAIGGPRYQELLAASLGALAAAPADPAWGKLVLAKADADPEPLPWFVPPRPLDERHFEALRVALTESVGAGADSVASLARFHYVFVRVHPFVFANQSVAMSLANHVLRRELGAGIPHHVLDHLALRLPEPAYRLVFERAVREWLARSESPVERTLALVEKKRRAFEFLHALADASVVDARRLVRERPEGARLVLLGP